MDIKKKFKPKYVQEKIQKKSSRKIQQNNKIDLILGKIQEE